jgi:uncharacterized protein YndB with AHSA1/START domain
VSERNVVHDTFVIERRYDASRTRVFDAWADGNAKKQWFGAGGEGEHEIEFEVGGREFLRGSMPDGTVHTFDAHYQDIVANERIVLTYYMLMNGERISVSVATVEFADDGSATRLVYTEQGVYLDGLDDPRQREEGTGVLLDQLEKFLG